MIRNHIFPCFFVILFAFLILGVVNAADNSSTSDKNLKSYAQPKSSTSDASENTINTKDSTHIDKGFIQYSTTYNSPSNKKVLLKYDLRWDSYKNYYYRYGSYITPYGMRGSYNFNYIKIYGLGYKEFDYDVPFEVRFFNSSNNNYKVVCKIARIESKTFFISKGPDAYFKARTLILKYLNVNPRNALVKNINPDFINSGFVYDNDKIFTKGYKFADDIILGKTGIIDPYGWVDLKMDSSYFSYTMNWIGYTQNNRETLIYRENLKYTEKFVYNYDNVYPHVNERWNYDHKYGSTSKIYYEIIINLISTKKIRLNNRTGYNHRYKYTIKKYTDVFIPDIYKTNNPQDPGFNRDNSRSYPGKVQTFSGFEDVKIYRASYNIINVWKEVAIGHNNPNLAYKDDKFYHAHELVNKIKDY